MGLFGPGKKQRAAYEAEAAQLGLQFAEKDPFGIRATEYFLLPPGRSAGAVNVMHGVRSGGSIRLFDYGAERVKAPVVPLPDELAAAARGKRTEVSAGWAELRAKVPLVLLVPAASEATFRSPRETGDARIDERFRCYAPYGAAADAIGARPAVADLLATAPDDCAVELDGEYLLVVGDRRPLEQRRAFADFVVALRAALPPELHEVATQA